MKLFHKPIYGQVLFYSAIFLLLIGCNGVSIPTRDKDAAPLLTITAIDKTHTTSTSHKVDREEIYIAPGTLMQFIAVARNELGGVKTLELTLSDNSTIIPPVYGTPDGSGKVPVQLQIATFNNQAITKIYSEPGRTYEVTATADNHNNMLNSITLKIHVYNLNDPYTKSCGNFGFSGISSFPENFESPKMATTLSFGFKPALCNLNCNCKQVAFIQMIRFTDLSSETPNDFFQPNDQQESRMVRNNPNPTFNGWSIDRFTDMKWAYYARYNDGTWDDIANDPSRSEGWHIALGSNFTSAVMRDGINAEQSSYLCEVVAVPVCIDYSSGCNGQILGYFGFSFTRANGANVLSTATQNTYAWMPEAFDLAVAEWNKQSGKEKLFLRRIP